MNIPITFHYPLNEFSDKTRPFIMKEFASNGAKHLIVTAEMFEAIMQDSSLEKKLISEMAQEGLSFVDGHAPFGEFVDLNCPDKSFRDEMIARQKLTLNIAASMGLKTVTMHCGVDFLNAQIEDVETTREQLHKLINQLTHQMKEIFVEGFAKINENFSKTFTELFGGGTATLSLNDPENVLESGIDINAKLPGKNVPSLDGLSGGEKALIALSIYFAIMRVNAPPFCFLDEVDTALDDINVDRFADYMKNSDFATQFICVTHRRGTMEAADMLYGVTMQEKGITKLLELNVAELEKKLLEGNKGA